MTATTDRREAIRRAQAAVVRLTGDRTATAAAHRQATIASDPRHSTQEAWAAVAALEGMARSRGLVTAEELWRAQGRRLGAYDATGKTLEQLARDYVEAYARFKRTAEAYRQAAAGGPAGPDELHQQMEWLQSRMALVEEAIEAAGGGVDDEWHDEGSCRIYGPHCEVLATF